MAESAPQVSETERSLRSRLSTNLSDIEALSSLARLCLETARPAESVQLLRWIVSLQPHAAEMRSNLGMVLAGQGDLDGAIAEFTQALALRPDIPASHNNLANALRGKGELDQAIAEYRTAVSLQPDYIDAYTNLGSALWDKGAVEEALTCYRTVCALCPNNANAALTLAKALAGLERFGEATDWYRRALVLQPENVEALNELVVMLGYNNCLEEAIAVGRRALQLAPDMPQVHNNYGWVIQKNEMLEEAEAEYRRALELRPGYPEAQNNLASVLRDMGRFEQGTIEMTKALALQPDHPTIESNLGMMLLTMGDFEHGWKTYEARRHVIPLSLDRQNVKPRWDGSDLHGRRIVIQSEQGFGDSLHFVRYVPMVHDRGGHVILQCHPSLLRIFKTVRGADQIVSETEPLPEFDVYTRMLSLPGIFGTNLSSIPAQVPYVEADPRRVSEFAERIRQVDAKIRQGDKETRRQGEEARPADPSCAPQISLSPPLLVSPSALRVGLAWSGSPTHALDHLRSISLSALAPLAEVSGVQFYSLQKGPGAAQIKSPPPGLELIDWTEDLTDFADTAALVKNLDLVITVDSAVAHLAGALGAPVWVLVQFTPDWRWLLDRNDSPWYPTMRLFRQRRRLDWDEPIRQVAEELKSLACQRRGD